MESWRLGCGDDRRLRLRNRRGQREGQGETASGRRPRFHLDVAAMLPGQLSREVEAETSSSDMTGPHVLDPLEPVEEAR